MIPVFARASVSRLTWPIPWSAQLSLVAILGALQVLSFAPYGFWPVQSLGLAGLFLLLHTQTQAKRAFTLAWSFSFCWLAVSICWLLIAMTRYGGLPMWIALLALALLSALLALYAGLFALLAHHLRRRWQLSPLLSLLLLYPALWASTEWLRGWFLTGFPWGIAGYAHAQSPLAGFAPILGVYGLSWLAALFAAVLAAGLARVWQLNYPNENPHGKNNYQYACILGVTFTLLILGGSALRHVQWTHPHGQAISVRLLQGNVPQDIKFDQDHLQRSLQLYHDMIVAKPADLIVTPETALPILSSALPPDYLPRIQHYAHSTGSTVLLGLGMHDGAERYANSLLGFSQQQTPVYRYDKHHLLPFGEYIPFGLSWFVKMMNIPIGDFTGAGLYQAALPVRDQFILPNICYESLFGEEIAAQIRAAHQAGQAIPTILLNASNLAWYDEFLAISQHAQFARMRVLETGRPWLAATNTGATLVLPANNGIASSLAYQTQGSLEQAVQGYTGMTPYLYWGNLGILVILASVLLLALVLRKKS